jgi:hypothetical protein
MRKRKFKNRKKEITSGHGIWPGGANVTWDLWAAFILFFYFSKNAGAND